MDLNEIIRSERLANIFRMVLTVLTLLSVYFLGMNAAYYTNEQVKNYCLEYNNATCRNCALGGINSTGIFNVSNYTLI